MTAVDVLQLLNDYIAAFNGRDIVSIGNMLDENIVVFLNGSEVAKGRDNILPSYAKDFATDKTVSVGIQPFEVDGEPGRVVQVGLIVMEPAAKQGKKAKTTTSLTVRYRYGSDGRHIRHEISDIVVTE
jgi:ketosteroid isomerase-like protein